MIEFKLDPIEKVQPWGDDGDKRIHWFALTQGSYRIKVDDEYLLNYNEEFNNYCRKKHPEYIFPSTTSVEYYVVRFWEDLVNILPHILEPIPSKIQSTISLNYKSQLKWIADFDIYDEKTDYATSWLCNRHLNSFYLQNAPNIWFWSNEDYVFIHWDNSEIFVDEMLVWSALQGSFKMNRNEFINNIWSFHNNLFAEMDNRVSWICSNFANPTIFIDFEGLQREHKQRETFLESAMMVKPNTEWNEVTSALRLHSSRSVSLNQAS